MGKSTPHLPASNNAAKINLILLCEYAYKAVIVIVLLTVRGASAVDTG